MPHEHIAQAGEVIPDGSPRQWADLILKVGPVAVIALAFVYYFIWIKPKYENTIIENQKLIMAAIAEEHKSTEATRIAQIEATAVMHNFALEEQKATRQQTALLFEICTQDATSIQIKKCLAAYGER